MLSIVLFMLPMLLTRFSVKGRATNRILEHFQKAQAPLMREDAGLGEVEEFAAELRRIDLNGAPEDVRSAMEQMIETVEKNATVRRAHGDTNAVNDEVASAKRVLLRALDRSRGQPY